MSFLLPNHFIYFRFRFKTFTRMIGRFLRISPALRVNRNVRCQSTIVDPVLLDVNEKTGIATMTLDQKPVNNMTLNLLQSFCDKLDFLEKEKVKGMILTSVGLVESSSCRFDFMKLFFPVVAKYFLIWTRFQRSFQT